MIPISRRSALGGLAGVAAAGLLGGCAPSRGKVRLRFWSMGREGEMAEQLLQGFREEQPHIEVQLQKLPVTAAHEKLLTAFAGDTLPDLCQLGNTWVPEFAALDALQPLDEFLLNSNVIATEDYFADILDSNRIRDMLYGIPWYVDTRLLFYRTDILKQAGFSEPPRSWDEWVQMLAAIKDVVGPDRYSILLPLNEYDPLLVLALQQPEPLLRDGGRWGNFRSAGFHRALSFYANMFEQRWAPRMTNTQISNVWDEFGHGFYSFYISGPWNIAEFKKRLPEGLQDDWTTAPMPGPNGPGASTAGGSSLVIFRTSPVKREAWLLMEYLSRPETQRHFYELTGDMPSRRTTWEMPALAQSRYAKAFYQQLDNVRSPPKVPQWEQIVTEMRLAAERVVQHRSSVDEAAAALDLKADAILEKRRWMLDQGHLA